MKNIFLIITISIFTVMNLNTQAYSGEIVNNNSNPNDSSDLIQLENNWAAALVNKDETIFRKYLADNFIYTENEKMYTRAEVMESLLSGTDTVENAYNEDMQVHSFGKTAIVTGFLIVSGRGSGGKFIHKYRYTDTWLNTNGEWQIIGAQDFLLP